MARITIDTRKIFTSVVALVRLLLLPVSIILAAYIIGPGQIEHWNAQIILDYTRVLAWPITAIIIFITIRNEIPELAKRVKKAAVGPASLEFSELQEEASKTGTVPSPAESNANPGTSGRWNLAQTEQFRVDNLIASLYYSGLTNLALQVQLPQDIGQTANNGSANLVDQSYADFHTLISWIHAADDWEAKVAASPVNNLYRMIDEVSSEIRTVRDFYTVLAQRQSTATAA